MAVISTKIVRDMSAEYSNESTKRKLTIYVFVDDPSDGPDVVVLGCGFTRGDTWAYGNESDPQCELQRLNVVSRETSSRWVVEAEFERLADTRKLNFELQEGNAPGGSGYFNPEQLIENASTVRVSHRGRQIAKWKGTFLGFINADGTARNINNPQFVVNQEMMLATTNMVPLNPPIEEVEYDVAFIITTYKDRYNLTDSLIGKTNVDATTILTHADGIVQFSGQFAEDTLLCVQQDYDPFLYQKLPWNTVTLELLYRASGWYTEFLDAGLVTYDLTEYKSEGGGTYKGLPYIWKRILDATGNPITDPVPLDGYGNPITNTSEGPYNSVFLRYRTLVQRSFAGIYPAIQ